MDERRQNKRFYHISSVSRMFSIHPQTLRLYEREGLLKPSRSEKNTRLFSDEDIRQLEFILNLTRDMGVNLAGIEVILNMRKKIKKIEKEVNDFLEYIKREYFEGREEEFETKRNSIVRVMPAKVIKIEKVKTKNDKKL